MKRRIQPVYRSYRSQQAGEVFTLKKLPEMVPWYFSDLTWDDRMLCVGWVVLKSCLYDGEEWSMIKSEKEMARTYKQLMVVATKNDKKFIGNMANQILRLGGYK